MAWQDYGTEQPRYNGRMIIGLAGFARSGKDTVGKFLIDNHNFTRISFATPVYNGLYALNPIVTFDLTYRDGYVVDARPIRVQEIVNNIGWERAKVEYEEIRKLLQRYGTEAGRDIHGADCWVNLACKAIQSAPTTNFVVTDVRFPNEVAALKRLGAVLVKITRKGVSSVNSHISDQELPDELFHHFIRNNRGLAELEVLTNELIREKGPLRVTSGTQEPQAEDYFIA